MKKRYNSLYLALVLTTAIATMGLPVPAFSSGSAAEKDMRSLPQGQISRIAFGSCAKQWQHQSIWDTIIATEPDLFLFLRDAVYADTDGVTAWPVTKEQLQGEWNRLVDKPELAV